MKNNISSLKSRAGAVGMFLGILTMPWLALNATWQPPETLNNTADPHVTPLSGPVLSVNRQGNALAGWNETSDPVWGEGCMITNFYVRGIGWQGPVIISSLAGSTANKPLYNAQGDLDIAMNSSNYAIAGWEGEYAEDNFPNIAISTYRTPNGVWAPVTNLSDLSGNFFSHNVNVALNEPGTGIVVWRQRETTGPFPRDGFIMASILPLGGSYSAPIQISGVEGAFGNGDSKADPAINDAGDIVVVWYKVDFDDNGDGISAATFDATTSTWSPAVDLDADPLGLSDFDLNPRVAIDPNGNAIAIWNRNGEARASVFTPGSGWAAYQVVANDLSGGNPMIVMDSAGNATATWSGDTVPQMYTAYKPFGQPWGAPKAIGIPGENNDQFPFMSQEPTAVDGKGNVMTVWGVDTDTLYSAYRLVGQPWQAPEIIFMEPFQARLPSVGLADCGFAVALWYSNEGGGGETFVRAAVNENFFAPFASGLVKTNCTQKFAMQKVKLDILTWVPFTDCILFYNVYCNGIRIAVIPGTGPFEFINPTCNACTYTLTTTNIWGFESDPVPFTL